jgi:hypothetical protein
VGDNYVLDGIASSSSCWTAAVQPATVSSARILGQIIIIIIRHERLLS